ncbi:hypothetical protein [Lactococcus termiticola]|uniref:Uncharacterized protein n=1 Tax=Lactococcus termiticola TaxID=2169526 RepID=A0A2R5HJG7_9LACT|nr:hypothetical protein [Lactococcus termiticola]GBG96728.1 hypothetical protein NtB2_00852 [Lactococcus termiticola]
MYTHNTFPSVAQGLKCPMWLVPETYKKYKEEKTEYISENDIQYNGGAAGAYRKTLEAYKVFAADVMKRSEVL